MNKKITKLIAAIALLTFLIPFTGWGQTNSSVTMAYSGSTTTNMTGNNDAALVGLDATDWSVVGAKGANSNFPGLNKAGDIRLYYHQDGSNTITVTALNDSFTISNIVITYTSSDYNNGKVFVGNNEVTIENGAYAINSTSFVVTNGNTSNVQVRISSIEINYTSGGGTTPSIAANNVDIAYNATAGSIAYTLNNATGNVTAAVTSGNWLTLGTVTATEVPFTCSANTETTARTAQVTLSFTGATDKVVTITQAGVPSYTVTYDCNGGTSGCPDNVTGITSGTQIQLADAPSKDDYIFEGWSDGTTTYGENVDYIVTGDVTFTAQWTADPSAPTYEWVETALADLGTSDVFVIVGDNGSTYAMTNDNGTSSAPAASAVTVENGKITSTVDDNLKWNIGGNATDGYTFYPNGSTTTWLYCTNTNNGVRVGTNASKTFVINSDYLYHSGTGRHVGIYNSQDWRCYSPQSGNVHGNISGQTFAFYKRQVATNDPYITAGNVDIEYDATGGSIAFTVNNEVTGGVISAATTDTWITLGTETTSPISFTCSANTEATARTATVTLTYTYNTTETVTKDVTIIQAAAPVIYTTIPAIFAAATGTETDVTITFNNWVVSAVKNSNAYLTDNNGNGLIIYASGHGFAVNDVLSGTASCILQLYNGSAELKNLTSTTTGLTVTANGTVTEQTIAINSLTGVNTGALLHYDDLTYNGTALVDADDNTITPYSTLYSYTFENGKSYNVTGIYLQYNTTKEILPRSAADIEEVVVTTPAITFSSNTINATAAETDGTIDVTYENLTNYLSEVQFTTSDGVTAATYDWLDAEIRSTDDTKLDYTIGENTGSEARTAYMKVYAVGDEGDAYSSLITISQAGATGPVTTGTITFGSATGSTPINSTSVTGDDSMGNTWTITTVFSGETSFTQNSAYSQVGASSKPATSITFTTTLPQATTITAFEAKFGGFSGTAGDINLLVGETNVGTGSLNASNDVTVTNTTTATGTTLTVTVTNIAKGVKCYYISYTVSTSTAPMINAPATVNLDSDATSGEIAYTIINPATGVNLQATSTDTWISNIAVANDKVTFTTTANTETTERQGIVTLSYTGAESKEVTIIQAAYVPPVVMDNYARFTGDLIEGDYLIVYDDGAMNTTVTSDRLQFNAVTVNDDVIATDDAAIIWHIAPSGDYWTIYNADANAYAASTGAKNKAQMLADGTDDKALWTVSGTEVFEFVNKANAAASVNANLRKNSSYGFACYATGTGGSLKLYKKVTSTVAYSKTITGYGTSETDGYYLIASPIYGLDPESVTGMTTGTFDLYKFDQAEDQEWRNYEASPFYLIPGKGYLYAKSDNVTLTFNGMPYEGNGVVALDYSDGANLAGWNLIGNPFATSASLDKAYYRLNPEGNALNATTESTAVAAMEGVFVQATAENQYATFTVSSKADGRKSIPSLNVMVSHERGVVIDNAIFRFDDGATLSKFMLDERGTKLCVPVNGKEYAIVNAQTAGEMPLNFKAAENGTYTLSVEAENLGMDYLHLIDNLTGANIDLLATPSYTFNAKTTDYASRFRLVFSMNGVIEENVNETFAYINGDEIVITNADAKTSLQVVDMMGRVLVSTKGTNSLSTAGLTQGVYVIRLFNGENVKTQKIVIQ